MAKKVVFCFLLWVFPLLLLKNHLVANNRTKDRLAEEWGRAVLKDLPPKAVVCVYSDLDIFTLAYLIHLDRFRSDITLIHYNGDAITEKEYQTLLWPWLNAQQRSDARSKQIFNFLINEKRGVYSPIPPPIPKGFVAETDGFLLALVPEKKSSGQGFKNRLEQAEGFFKLNLADRNFETPLGWAPYLREWTSIFIGTHYVNLALNHLEKRDTHKLMETLQQLLPFAENSPYLAFRMGEIFLMAGSDNYDKASLLFKTSIELSRNLWLVEIPGAWYSLGQIMIGQKHWAGALYYTTQALQRDPKMANAYGQMATIYTAMGKEDLAVNNLKKALELDPQLQEAQLLLDKLKAPKVPEGRAQSGKK